MELGCGFELRPEAMQSLRPEGFKSEPAVVVE